MGSLCARLTRHIADWMEYATAAGLREGDVLSITRTADTAGGGGPGEVVELHAALLSRAQFCLPPTYAGARLQGFPSYHRVFWVIFRFCATTRTAAAQASPLSCMPRCSCACSSACRPPLLVRLCLLVCET